MRGLDTPICTMYTSLDVNINMKIMILYVACYVTVAHLQY